MNLMKRWEILNSRVVAFYQQGWFSVAVNLAEETLAFAERAFGPDHPRVAESLNNLALIYYTQGKDAESSMVERILTQLPDEMISPKASPTAQRLNQLVLVNLAKRKYSLAESLFRRALEIKKNGLGQEDSQLLRVLRSLADLRDTKGKCAEVESNFKALGVPNNEVWQGVRTTAVKREDRETREPQHEREHMRCSGRFPAKLAHSETGVSISGVTENISQWGAFIKTRNWRAFRTNDQVSVAISLPSVFPDQIATVDMEGPGIIFKVDEENEGVAVEFMKSFKQFKRLAEKQRTEVAGKIRYKKLAQYIKDLGDKSLTDFLDTHPKGFLVEKIRMDFDSDVIFQFSTKRIDLTGVLNELSDDLADANFLESRAIEISKRKIDNNEGVINIGRSANNDIVLYNKTVSKSHAFIHFTSGDGTAQLTDLESKNCTFLNNKKIVPYMMHQLADGDEISFGPQTKVTYLSTSIFYHLLTSLKHSEQGRVNSWARGSP